MEGKWNLYIYRYIWVAFNPPKGSSPPLLAGTLALHCVIRVSHGPSKNLPPSQWAALIRAGAGWTATGWLQLLANPAAGRGTKLGAGPAGEIANQGNGRSQMAPSRLLWIRNGVQLAFLTQTCVEPRSGAGTLRLVQGRPRTAPPSFAFLRDIMPGNTV